MAFAVIAPVLCLCTFAPFASAESFLGNTRTGQSTVSFQTRSEELQAALGAVSGCKGNTASNQQSGEIRKHLLDVWQSLPKNEFGRVGWKLLRYAAHRHFMQRFGVLVRGLEPSIKVNASHAGEAAVLSQEAPVLAQQLSASQAGHGFSLEDAVAMVVALEQLLFDSDGVLLEKVYDRENLNHHQTVDRKQLQKVLTDYMVYWMLGDDQESAAVLLQDRKLLVEAIPHWNLIVTMVEGSVRALEYSRQMRPQSGSALTVFHGKFTFVDALEVAGSIGRQFASFWEPQCYDTKASLLVMDKSGTGRVRLPDFYGANKEGEWRFGESEAYLRELGALDETSSWKGKQVIVSNYMQAASNCVVTRQHFLVCCRVECEDILGEVEVAVGAPVAGVEDLLRIVSTISDSKDNYALIGDGMRKQLQRVANTHGGEVPLHGRLFAQWLHYAFPRECAFPHKAGVVSALTPTQFGDASIVNADEVNQHVAEDVVQQDLNAAAGNSSAEEQWMTQWSEEEELLVDHSQQLNTAWVGTRILPVFGILAVVGLVWSNTEKGVHGAHPTTHRV